jgi:hypothetical protein
MVAQIDKAKYVLFHDSGSMNTVEYSVWKGTVRSVDLQVYELFAQTGCICKGKALNLRRMMFKRLSIMLPNNYACNRQQYTKFSRNVCNLAVGSTVAACNCMNQVPYTFCCDFLLVFEDKLFPARIVFVDEATFHLSGNVN